MSGNDKSNSIDRALIDAMSTEELKTLFKQEAEQPGSVCDVDTLIYISEVLDIRETEHCQPRQDTDAAWETFQRAYLPLAENGISLYDNEMDTEDEHSIDPKPAKKKRKLWRSLGVAAAIVLVLFAAGTIIPTANGSSVWSAFVDWTKEAFGYSHSSTEDRAEIPEQLEELRTLMEEHGILIFELLPMYIPDGYVATSTFCEEQDDIIAFYCVLENGENSIVLQYILNKTNSSTFEYQKNNSAPTAYVKDGITHYIVQNVDCFTCAWSVGAMECCIQNVPSQEELIKMIDSIYEV